MTHAEYVAQEYEPIYQVTEPAQNTDDSYFVLILGPDTKCSEYTFSTLQAAEDFAAKEQAAIDEREVDIDWDNPEQEYKAQIMNELAARGRA